jgi:hypothetical protein
MSEEDIKQLSEKVRTIAQGSEAYVVYRVKQLVEHAIKEAEERGYVAGWNASCALDYEPEKMKPIKRSYGFKNV